MKTEQTRRTGPIRQVRRAALAAGVGAVLVGGVLLFVPDRSGGPAAPSPEARALAAVGAGAPAALPDLAALVRDREARVRDHPDDDGAWAVLGAAYVERGTGLGDPADYGKAEHALRRSLAVRPEDAGAAGGPGAGAASGADGKAKGAAPGGNPGALAGLGALANARHDYAAAKRWGESLRARRPAEWTAYPVLITAYRGLGDYTAAGKALTKLKDLRSDTPVLTRAAEVYRDRGWREDAEAKATEAVARAASPAEKTQALGTLGELAGQRGEHTEALGRYDAALAVTRDHAPALAGRARALAALGRTDEASRAYQSALSKQPNPEYALELGELYDSMGLDGDARTQYATLRARTGAAQRRGGVNEELVLARFEADHGDPQAAVLRMKSEWREGRRSMAVADALGWALYRAGQEREALPYAKKASEQGVRSALFAYHRGEIERSLGMAGAARRHIEEALRTDPHFSPLLVPRALDALDDLGEPAGGGPAQMDATAPPEAPTRVRKPGAPKASPSPSPKASASASASSGT
ncbi:tetratricopeptide repeat protein [Streptomyces paludis]|uniref:Tetratricopeptide repeat protein n=2 Tax=Streptomyces paludis TaxID=2282738 RepID=A0A345I0N2_9ACTN|nr:tetratricopeptide repeat protein [Streptomyces paludis]